MLNGYIDRNAMCWCQVEQCRRMAETLISSYPECDTPGLIQAAQYVRQKNVGQAIECLQVRSELFCHIICCVVMAWDKSSAVCA